MVMNDMILYIVATDIMNGNYELEFIHKSKKEIIGQNGKKQCEHN